MKELARAMENAGHAPTLISVGDRPANAIARSIYKNSLKRILPLPIARIFRDAYTLLHDLRFSGMLTTRIKAINPDIILARHSTFQVSPAIYSKRLGLPIVLDDISPIWEEERYYDGLGLKRIAYRLEDRVFGIAQGLVAVSRVMYKHLVDRGIPESKISIISNGADTDRFRPDVDGNHVRERYGIEKKIVVGFVGSMAPWHGTETLLDAADVVLQQRSDVHFLLIGGGSAYDPIRKSLDGSGMSKYVTVTGALPYEQIPACMAAMDVATMPNSNEYGSPIKIAEYMAMGKAIVAPRLPPIQEMIADGENGLLAEPGDIDALIAMILYLIDRPEERQRLGQRARNAAISRFNWPRLANKMLMFMQGLLQHQS